MNPDKPDGSPLKDLVVNVLTVATMIVLAALVAAPVLWIVVTIYRAIL